jgi:L-alanine-DL-glutamate epimerase-like enolase superfamily enzyme
MKIVDVTATRLFYPHTRLTQNSTSLAPAGGRGQLFVHIKTDEGLEGLGVGMSAPGVDQIVENGFSDLLIGRDPLDIERLWHDLFWRARQFGSSGIAAYALSAVDIGLWDLKAKALNLPLYKLLGPYADSVPMYGSGGWVNLAGDELLADVNAFLDQGIRRVKIRVARDRGSHEREDIERVAAVRQAIGDDVALYIDANNGYYPKQAIYMAKEFEQYHVGFFEEPVLAQDVGGLAQIREAIDIPLAIGEQEYSKIGFRELISAGAVDIVQPDVATVGGVTEWLKVAHMAEAFNIPVAPHLVQLVHVHLACAIPNLKVVEYMSVAEEADREWYTDVPEHKDGMLSPFPDRPGLGLELDPYAVEKWAV